MKTPARVYLYSQEQFTVRMVQKWKEKKTVIKKSCTLKEAILITQVWVHGGISGSHWGGICPRISFESQSWFAMGKIKLTVK